LDPFFYIFVGSIVFVSVLIFLYYFPIALWLKARAAGAPVGFFTIVRLRIMGIEPAPIVNAFIVATKAGIQVSMDQLTAHQMAGGHIEAVIARLIQAKRENDPLNWGQASAIDFGAPESAVRGAPKV
jgi:uncharacterized protein YqfA (UPF0365 family)